MGKVKRKNGISLIVLVITILVMIILAGVVVVTMSENNPINKAKEANFKSDIATFQEDLSMHIANKLAMDSSVKVTDIDAKGYDAIKKVVNSFTKKYENKIEVVDGKIVYVGTDKDELAWAGSAGVVSKAGLVNAPVLSSGMIPVKYNGTKWEICSSSDPSWYNYENKQWANVMLSDGKYKAATPGTVVEDADLGSMFVWIPRFAYSIKKYKVPAGENGEGTTQELNTISFLKNGTNVDYMDKTHAKTYDAKLAKVGEATTSIVHPAFSFGGKEISGFWMGKYEASMYGENLHTQASCNKIYANLDAVKVVPGTATWRYISIGNMFANVKNMQREGNGYGLSGVIDTHLVRNSEWGAVAYLTTSKYGVTPVISNSYTKLPNANEAEGIVMYAGGGENSAYKNNVLQSTTGNVTGIYDMNGGAWEYVAAYHDNKNDNLLANASVLFDATSRTLKTEYEKYMEKYDVSANEKDNSIHRTIWNAPKNDATYGNTFRKNLSLARLDHMASHLGDGMYEITDKNYIGFLGKSTDINYTWLKDVNATSAENGTTLHNQDFMLIGNIYHGFILRGGSYANSFYSGIFASCGNPGDSDGVDGFRPAIVSE